MHPVYRERIKVLLVSMATVAAFCAVLYGLVKMWPPVQPIEFQFTNCTETECDLWYRRAGGDWSPCRDNVPREFAPDDIKCSPNWGDR